MIVFLTLITLNIIELIWNYYPPIQHKILHRKIYKTLKNEGWSNLRSYSVPSSFIEITNSWPESLVDSFPIVIMLNLKPTQQTKLDFRILRWNILYSFENRSSSSFFHVYHIGLILRESYQIAFFHKENMHIWSCSLPLSD